MLRCKLRAIRTSPTGRILLDSFFREFPLLAVEWLAVFYVQEVRVHRLPPQVDVIN